jgi:hypothetical protein
MPLCQRRLFFTICPSFPTFANPGKCNISCLILVVCAVISGSEGWDETEDFGHSKLNFLRQYGNFTGGIPSHDTLARVMALINADQLKIAFAEWMKACHDVTDTKTTQASRFARLPGDH